MEDVWAQLIGSINGAVISGLVGVGIALYTIKEEKNATVAAEQRAAAERELVLRRSLAVEIDQLLLARRGREVGDP
jgi:hypothetical protein